ncbi:FAD-binding oxidoreductase [Mesorhizobium sp. M1060]|uniref:FAD-binding oxidoreductase n=1 Tax=Mesorhizobium sp. M1060 TaxID=2957052 RepID=UPI0033373587
MTTSNPLASPKWQDNFATLARGLGAVVICPEDYRYDEARLLYNRMHDLRPAFIVRTGDANGIAALVAFANTHGVEIAVRGGGHHIAGFGSCDDGIVIDFSTFRSVRVNAHARTVRIDPGARLSDVDEELARHGLVIPTGTVSSTGLAGLTFGGGIGWLVGRFGLTCDHLIGADVVLASGEIVRAEDHPDLLWGMRGGGGNFGVVTNLRFRAQEMPNFVAGAASIDRSHLRSVLSRLIAYMDEGCPPALTIAPTMTASPNGPSLSVDFCLVGDNRRPLEELRRVVGDADWSLREDGDFPGWQAGMDHLFEPPMRGYWKSRYSTAVSDEDIKAIVEAISMAPDMRCIVTLEHLHGEFRREPMGRSAFPLRHAKFGVLVAARWPDAAHDDIAKAWVRKALNAIDPQGNSAAYSNYSDRDDLRCFTSLRPEDRVRLVDVKRRYDPTNLFRRNHNIAPRLELL